MSYANGGSVLAGYVCLNGSVVDPDTSRRVPVKEGLERDLFRIQTRRARSAAKSRVLNVVFKIAKIGHLDRGA